MTEYKNKYFAGERILYGLNDAILDGVTFDNGESPLKEAKNITFTKGLVTNMQCDFENAPDRSRVDSVKWDVKLGELPMWIADMDFKTAPEIIAAMQQKLHWEHLAMNFRKRTILMW